MKLTHSLSLLFGTVAVSAGTFLVVSACTAPEPVAAAAKATPRDACVACHRKHSPGIVSQWRASRHAEQGVSCDSCHGDRHRSGTDARLAALPTPKTCEGCHPDQVKQFGAGKHARAWAAASAIPMIGRQPAAIAGKGCYACHGIGKPHEDGSTGRCDSCHTRHLFSKAEARKPEACETCHMGEDHSQYEMWRSAKHGVIHHLDPDSGRAPVCQTCHMDGGDHAVKTGWGFLALRLPIEDKAWADAQMKVIKALGPWGWDEKGMAERVGAIKALGLARLEAKEFRARREKMIAICARCHARRFATDHFRDADAVIRASTMLMARAIDVVQELYDDRILPAAPDGPKHVDLLLFYDSPTPIEQELYQMFLFHRQKLFQGAIHANPDYTHWYGWAPMKTSFVKIQAMARTLRAEARR